MASPEKVCPAISLESCDVYALRGASGWERSAEILWENGRYISPCLMAKVECQVQIRCKQCSGSTVSNEKWPPVCSWSTSGPTELLWHARFLFRLTARSTNNCILHVMHFISRGLSLHITIFDFIVRKGVPLIMVIQRTITGVKFPSVPCEPQIACPPQREP